MADRVSKAQALNLLDLPSEVLSQVFDVLRQDEEFDALRATLLASRSLQEFAESALYRSIAFQKRSSMQTLAKALEADPRRLGYVHDLALQWSTKSYQHGDLLPPDLKTMKNLRTLLSESPECQPHSARRRGKWVSDMQNCLDAFEQGSLRSPILSPKPLQHLLSMTLHWSGETDRLWSIKPSCPIFLLPSLLYLKISCVMIVCEDLLLEEGEQKAPTPDPEWDTSLDEFRHKTALETLILEESVVPPYALKHILSLPKALRHFDFEEAEHHRIRVAYPQKHLIGNDPQTFNIALTQQCDSLESLSFLWSYFTRVKQDDTLKLSLSKFRNLSKLHIGRIRDRRQAWRLSGPPPPNLTLLGLPHFIDLDEGLPAPMVYSGLKIDEMITNATNRGQSFGLAIKLRPISFYEAIGRGNLKQQVEAIVIALENRFPRPGPGLVDDIPKVLQGDLEDVPQPASSSSASKPYLRISSVKIMGPYIPPYLHGETLPEETILYDSRRGMNDVLVRNQDRGFGSLTWDVDHFSDGEWEDMLDEAEIDLDAQLEFDYEDEDEEDDDLEDEEAFSLD